MKKKTVIGTLSVAFLSVVALASCGPTTKTYHVKFTNGNELVDEKDYKEGEEIIAPADPTPPTEEHKIYTFDGWYDGEDKFVIGTKATKNVEYIAKFNGEDIKYTVTFMNGKTEFAKITDAKFGDPIVAPQDDPEHEKDKEYEYTFDDWYYQGTDDPLEEGDTVEGNTVLEARYTLDPIDYDVKFTKDGQTTTEQFNIEDLSVTAPIFTPTAHYTGIWSSDGEHAGEKTADSGATIEFTADDLGDWEFKYVESATPYLITFEKGGQTVSTITKKITDSSLEFTAPEFTPTTHYDGEWYCEKLDTSLGSGATCTALTAQNLDNYTFVYQEEPHEYSVTFKKDGETVDTKKIKIGGLSVTAPTFTPTEHFSGAWVSGEKMAGSGATITFTESELKNWEFNYAEEAIAYSIKFVKGDQTVSTITKKITDASLDFTAPTFTPTTHYDGEWYCAELGTGVSLGSGEECTALTSSNLDNYTFIYDEEAHDYEVEFYSLDEGELLDTKTISVDDSTFTAPTVTPTTHYDGSFVCKSHTGISSIGSGEEVTIPTESLDDYKFVWEETEHEYSVIFYDLDGEEVEEATVSLSSKTITAPEITDEPEEGYHYAWVSEDPALVLASEGSTTLDDDDLADYYFYETAIGNEYTITYDANGGTLGGTGTTDTFTYGEAYSLRTATYDLDDAVLAGWNNTATKKNVPSTGTWDIADDVTLKAQYGISFDGYEVGATTIDSFNNPTNCSIEIAEDAGTKVLKVSSMTGDYGVKINRSYLDAMFADSNVTGVSFMAKTDVATCNFRYRIGDDKICYERNQNGWGLCTYWKTFTFTRAAYESSATTDYMIYGGAATNQTWVEIKNIKPTTDSLKEFETTARGTSFEGGWLRSLSDNNPLYYNAGVSAGGDVNLLKALEFGALSSHTAFISDELATDGNLSLGFTRAAASTDWMSLCVFNIGNAKFDYTVSFDFYSDIRLNSYGTTQNISDGKDKAFGDDGWHVEPNTWTHFDLTTSQMSDPSAAGRTVFMKVKGSATFPQFNFYIDNIVFTPIV